ncbi:hypothetical protein DXG03_005582 [Asterophora parasitica]|uniref:Uncharacterized protein n=1 Tax=Asterophora parasitica TaxID=117018 RepID=A0A9P7K8M1_9AGAR|nr:hypothetical protein DXG03_005582 [Asterophora parasitica]
MQSQPAFRNHELLAQGPFQNYSRSHTWEPITQPWEELIIEPSDLMYTMGSMVGATQHVREVTVDASFDHDFLYLCCPFFQWESDWSSLRKISLESLEWQKTSQAFINYILVLTQLRNFLYFCAVNVRNLPLSFISQLGGIKHLELRHFTVIRDVDLQARYRGPRAQPETIYLSWQLKGRFQDPNNIGHVLTYLASKASPFDLTRLRTLSVEVPLTNTVLTALDRVLQLCYPSLECLKIMRAGHRRADVPTTGLNLRYLGVLKVMMVEFERLDDDSVTFLTDTLSTVSAPLSVVTLRIWHHFPNSIPISHNAQWGYLDHYLLAVPNVNIEIVSVPSFCGCFPRGGREQCPQCNQEKRYETEIRDRLMHSRVRIRWCDFKGLTADEQDSFYAFLPEDRYRLKFPESPNGGR